jgi:hypothetical protein
MKRVFTSAAACLFIATSAFSATTTYQCEVTRPSSDRFVDGPIFLSIDEKTDRAAVVDPVVYSINNKKPMSATVERKDKRLTFRWEVRNVPTRDGAINVGYRATLNLSQNRLSVRAYVRGYDNSSSGSGRCILSPGNDLF